MGLKLLLIIIGYILGAVTVLLITFAKLNNKDKKLPDRHEQSNTKTYFIDARDGSDVFWNAVSEISSQEEREKLRNGVKMELNGEVCKFFVELPELKTEESYLEMFVELKNKINNDSQISVDDRDKVIRLMDEMFDILPKE